MFCEADEPEWLPGFTLIVQCRSCDATARPRPCLPCCMLAARQGRTGQGEKYFQQNLGTMMDKQILTFNEYFMLIFCVFTYLFEVIGTILNIYIVMPNLTNKPSLSE